MPRARKRDKTRTSLKALVVLQSGVIFYFCYWMLMQYLHDDYFRVYVDTTFGRYLSPLVDITIGAAGMGFCSAWVVITYRHETQSSGSPSKPFSMPSLPHIHLLGRHPALSTASAGTYPSGVTPPPTPAPSPPPAPVHIKSPMEKLVDAPPEEIARRAQTDSFKMSTNPDGNKMLNSKKATDKTS